MTREEQIVEYANSFKGKGIESDELKEIVRLAIIDGAKWADAHPQEPSLPSNLTEAAKEYANYNSRRWHEDGDVYYDYSKIMDAFKAGAEWMARQGSSFKVNVEEVPQGHWYAGLHLGGCAEEEENALKSINAKDGEEVIVQIRKK